MPVVAPLAPFVRCLKAFGRMVPGIAIAARAEYNRRYETTQSRVSLRSIKSGRQSGMWRKRRQPLLQ